MESSITLHIHHGGEFAEKNGVKYYKGGKVEYAYNLRLDVLSIPMFENYIRTDLGYKEFKIYWLSGSLFSDYNCKLLWNDDSLEQMIAYALKSDRIDVYVDHACEIEEGEGSDDSEKEDGNEDDSVEDSDSKSEKEDGSEDEDYNCNLSDCDEVMQKKKSVYKNKSNPTQSIANEDVEDMPFTSQLNCKNKQVMEEDGKGFESEYDSVSFKIVGEEISDSSDDDIADSVGTKKKVRKVLCKAHMCKLEKNHPGTALKNLFWMAAKSTTLEEFNMNMDEIKDNNLSECFNSWIVEARYKPILDLLDDIRLQVMERLYKKRDWMKGVDSTLCPRIVKKMNYSIEGTRFCKSTWAGGDECEVRDIDGGQWVVDMVKMIFSCRTWELSGIPCTHACQALQSMNQRPEDKVDTQYFKNLYIDAYSNLLKPMKGTIYWPKTGFPDIVPPKARRIPGRPKKHRRREHGEDGGGQKLEEITDIQKTVAEAKKAQSEAARAQAALNRSKKATSQKKKTAAQGEASTEGAPQLKRKRGRPPKAKNVEVLPPPPPLPPVGVGVYRSDKDGHIYMSIVGGSTVRVSSSQPAPTKPSQPSRASKTCQRMSKGKKITSQP
ncbi:hypothetical protein POM88_044847 [Heracleum sosnowskyi]|uniref:Zinc finger PMZ-type domain-containing protein n=1 Tax=Heracleum sosnowskyi TaxID=360622 RepID=A0AAD8H606_9APIA|nr:hypothetical protein POM88_044847 [Heracleum sosnowskyi]